MKPNTPEELLKWAAGRCAQKEYCSIEMVQKLCQKGLMRDQAEDIAQKLTEQHFIDEARYAKAFVHDKIHYNHWGRIKTRYMLQQKGIDGHCIEDALAEIDDATYSDILLNVLKNKSKSIKAKNEYEHLQKLMRFAAGRGFESEEVLRAFSRLF